MALDELSYLICAHKAPFHLQIRLEEIPEPERRFDSIACRGRVERAFHDQESVSIGDEVWISLPVLLSDGNTQPAGEFEPELLSATCWMPWERLQPGLIIEVFAGGDAPRLRVADHNRFTRLLNEPTDEPGTPRPTEGEVDERFARSRGWTPGEARRRMLEEAADSRRAKSWRGKPRPCPECGTVFTSVQDMGGCPECGLNFRASSMYGMAPD